MVFAQQFEDGDDGLASPILVVLTVPSDDIQEPFERRLVGVRLGIADRGNVAVLDRTIRELLPV